jgi:hypothetical protein
MEPNATLSIGEVFEGLRWLESGLERFCTPQGRPPFYLGLFLLPCCDQDKATFPGMSIDWEATSLAALCSGLS